MNSFFPACCILYATYCIPPTVYCLHSPHIRVYINPFPLKPMRHVEKVM